MADKTESELNTVEQAVYHDVDDNELSMLLRVHQNNGRALPLGSFTERKISQVIHGATGVAPTALTLLGPDEVLLEFEKEASVVQVGIAIQALADWDDLKVRTHCVMASRNSLIDICHERARNEREKQELREEKARYQHQLGQVVERIGSQIEQLDRRIEAEGPPVPTGVVTPPFRSPRQEVQQLVMAPGLPQFSGSEPTPRDEGTYEQWKFQVRGMRAACPESAVRSALITSLRGEASELVGFVGFNSPLTMILEAIDKRFGKRATTDRLQQEFFQLQQERGERIQHFASRLERAFKKLHDAFLQRYREEHLKERLFHGVNQQTRDSMRFLYSKSSTTYDTLLSAIKEAEIEWTEDCEQSFDQLKQLCSNTPVLAYPDYKQNFKLYTDASESGLGAVLAQIKEDGLERPVAYASRTLSKSERNYDAHKLEFLALKWAITDRFHEYLYGGTFDVYTDNNPLMYILTSAKLDAVGQRWVASLGPYNFSLHYNPGRQNTVADSLSRIPWENVEFHDEVDYNVVKAFIHKGESNVSPNIEPELIYDDQKIYIKQLVANLAGKMTKQQWKTEQLDDPEIGPVIRLVEQKKHLQYKVTKKRQFRH